ncbi:MAG TPA: flagellar basal body rod protein FlgB [bacterium]|nr:flagellar basal body rod protein FlgB [bacterium]
MRGIFDQHLQLLHKSLDFRAKRNVMLASNIANIETPGYKAKDLVFENALGEAMKADQPGPLEVTNPRHLDGRQILPLSQVKPQVILTSNPVGNLDDNSVDLEREMVKLGENQVVYQALTQMVSNKFAQLRMSIREGDF